MSNSVLVKESKRITRQAKHIFGDIIEVAYFAYKSCDEDYSNEVLYGLSDQNNTSKEISIVDIGCLLIVIKFKNGSIVSFTSSEWGSIEKVKEIKMYSPDKNK